MNKNSSEPWMQGSEVNHTFGQFIPRIWSSFSLSLSFLEFLLPLSSNYYYLKFCPLIIRGSKPFFFFKQNFTCPAEHKPRPPWAKLMSWEFTSNILVFHLLTSVQRLPALIAPQGLQVVVFYTFLRLPAIRVYSCHCGSVGQIGTLTRTGSGNPYLSHWYEQCKWSHLRDGKMRPGKETRSQRVSGRAISYDIKSGGWGFSGSNPTIDWLLCKACFPCY